MSFKISVRDTRVLLFYFLIYWNIYINSNIFSILAKFTSVHLLKESHIQLWNASNYTGELVKIFCIMTCRQMSSHWCSLLFTCENSGLKIFWVIADKTSLNYFLVSILTCISTVMDTIFSHVIKSCMISICGTLDPLSIIFYLILTGQVGSS